MPIPLEITRSGPREITIRWDDGHVSVYGTSYLRGECTCASCVHEITGFRILDPRTISPELTITSAEPVGRYGVRFRFTDTHDTGIYTWEQLRKICPCDACRGAASPDNSDLEI